MQCLTEIISPTAVTHAISLPFISKAANNLVVVKTSLLQIFTFKSLTKTYQIPEHRQSTTANDLNGEQKGHSGSTKPRPEKRQTTKLVLVGQFELSGTVTSLGRVKLLRSKSGGDALLIASRDAKSSFIEWDPDLHSISTISIHLYEREDLQGSPWDPPLSQCRCQLAVDPRSRCAALKFGQRHLAILPFNQGGDDLAMDDLDGEGDVEGSGKKAGKVSKTLTTPYAASFVLSLLALDPQLTQPIDLTFVHEFREPTFGILYSHGKTSNALLHDRRDIVSFALFTLDIEQRASTALITVDGLPYDLWAVVALRSPIGGVLLLGSNEIIHVDESGKTVGIAVNESTKISTSFALQDFSSLGLRLENCVVEQLGWQSDEVAVVTDRGELAIITFGIDGRQISDISIRLVQSGLEGSLVPAQPTSAAIVGRGRLFIGSQSGDAVVLGWSRTTDKAKRRRSSVDVDMAVELEGSDFDDQDIDDDEDDLYASNKTIAPPRAETRSKTEGDSYGEESFYVHDRLRNIGPLKDVTLAKDSSVDSTGHFNIRLVASSGSETCGSLTSINRDFTLETLKTFEFDKIFNLWTLQRDSIEAAGDEDANKEKLIIINKDGQEGGTTSHILELVGATVKEMEASDFEPGLGASIEVGLVNNGNRIVQVLENMVRLYEKGKSPHQASLCIPCLSFWSLSKEPCLKYFFTRFIVYSMKCASSAECTMLFPM